MTGTGQKPGSRPVLIAVDFSRDSDAAVDWGLRYAALLQAPVILFHAIHDTADAPGFYTRGGETGLVDISAVAQEMMDKQIAKLGPLQEKIGTKVAVTSKIVNGLPAGRIIEAATEEDAEVIVIGTRGRSKVTALLMGSVAETVAQKAARPVVVVKAQKQSEENFNE